MDLEYSAISSSCSRVECVNFIVDECEVDWWRWKWGRRVLL